MKALAERGAPARCTPLRRTPRVSVRSAVPKADRRRSTNAAREARTPRRSQKRSEQVDGTEGELPAVLAHCRRRRFIQAARLIPA